MIKNNFTFNNVFSCKKQVLTCIYIYTYIQIAYKYLNGKTCGISCVKDQEVNNPDERKIEDNKLKACKTMTQKSIFGRLFIRTYNNRLQSGKTGQEKNSQFSPKFITALLKADILHAISPALSG